MARRGEVWWAQSGGKVRPVLIVSGDALNQRIPKVLVLPGTTNIRGWPDEVTVDGAEFLPQRTAFCAREVGPINTAALQSLAGRLPDVLLDQVCATLCRVLDCR